MRYFEVKSFVWKNKSGPTTILFPREGTIKDFTLWLALWRRQFDCGWISGLKCVCQYESLAYTADCILYTCIHLQKYKPKHRNPSNGMSPRAPPASPGSPYTTGYSLSQPEDYPCSLSQPLGEASPAHVHVSVWDHSHPESQHFTVIAILA